jgi:ribonucleoside-diphosphate reductase alpha chain
MDHKVLSDSATTAEMHWFSGGIGYEFLEDVLETLKEVAIETNKEYAKKFGINPAAAITCVKPSGTVSQLVDSASGIHARYAKYYLRTVRADKKDPLAQMMKAKGYPCEDDVTKPDSGYVFTFPVKAPEGAITTEDRSAIEQLKLWKLYQEHWCEHKPSVTINVKEEEWLIVGAWVYANFDIISGVSFLPVENHIYLQPPYTKITKEEYEEKLSEMPEDIDWHMELAQIETTDTTVNTKELACSAGSCEI